MPLVLGQQAISWCTNTLSVVDLMTDEFICPVLNGMMWFIRIVNGSNTFCGSNDETSIACISDGGLCINSTMLSTDDSPQNLTFYHDNRHVEVIYGKTLHHLAIVTLLYDSQGGSVCCQSHRNG